MTLSLGLINLLEQLPELRDTFYLQDYRFVIKGAARWKRRIIAEYVGKGHRASMPSPGTPLSPNLHVFTNPELL